jgi:glutamate-1-semialdehyde aminotransferase
VFLPPSQFESWFLCSAMTHSDMRKFESAVDVSLAAVAEHH